MEHTYGVGDGPSLARQNFTETAQERFIRALPYVWMRVLLDGSTCALRITAKRLTVAAPDRWLPLLHERHALIAAAARSAIGHDIEVRLHRREVR